MDYEELFQTFKLKEKDVNDNLRRQQTARGNISKSAAKGDLKSLSKDLNTMDALISEYKSFLQDIRDLADNFDAQTYMENGDFAKQMLSYCKSLGVDVKGDFPVYEMFPYQVKIDSENHDVYINSRRMPCVRPQYLVSDIKQNKEKLMKASFNANGFLNELAEAYDVLTLKRKEKQGKEKKKNKRDLELLLKDIYLVMAPMQRFRKDYDIQSFAFDLSRLCASDVELTKDKRPYRLGPGRNPKENIRLLDKNGNETFFGTIIFYSQDAANEPAGK